MKAKFLISLLAVICVIASCTKTKLDTIQEKLVLPDEPYDYSTSNFVGFFLDNTPTNNPTTNEGATLGRVLFNDKRLSKSNIISCASCHKPQHGFADNKASSDGFVNEKTRRNSMAISNLKQKNSFFWDQREVSLEEQVMRPISDHIEMGIEDHELVPKLEGLDYYPELFENAFGSDEVTRERIAKALSQYLRAMESNTSKFDIGRQNGFQNYTVSETNGMNLFMSELPCGSCHSDNNLGGWSVSNIGLDLEYEDNGVAEISENQSSIMGGFSIPSLRNIELSAPYMHDGRFSTLEDVVEHYNSGIVAHQNLDSRLRNGFVWNSSEFQNEQDLINNPSFGQPVQLSLTESEKTDLVNFMKTLTDYTFIKDPKFSNPFVYEN